MGLKNFMHSKKKILFFKSSYFLKLKKKLDKLGRSGWKKPEKPSRRFPKPE